MNTGKKLGCFEKLYHSISSFRSSFHSFGKKAKRWYLNKLWIPLVFSPSLLVQSFRIFIVLFVFLLFVFFIPIQSYIGLSIETDHPTILNSEIEECSFLAEKATFTDINDCRISFRPGCVTLSYFDESTLSMVPVTIGALVSINGENDADLTYRFSELIIQPRRDLNYSMPPQIDVIAPDFDHCPNDHLFCCDISRTNNNTIKDSSCDSIVFGNSDFTVNRIVHEFHIIGDKRKFDNDVLKKAIDNPVRVEISSCYIQFLSEEKIIRQCDVNDTVVISFPLCMEFYLATSGANCYFSGISNLQCKVSQIHTLDLFGDGHITVTYTPDSKEYTILKQPITIISKDGSFLSSEISQSNDEEQDKEKKTSYIISAFGFADAVHLAGVSLLPDIFIWFNENVYLLPAMFVTVIIGSIQLIKIDKEKDNKLDKERKNEANKEEEKKKDTLS